MHHLFIPQLAGAQWFQPAHEPLRELVLVHSAEEAAANVSTSSQHTAAARPPHRPGASPRARPPLASESARETPMERAARERCELEAKAASVASSAKRDLYGDKERKGFLGALVVESCKSNFDCDRPMTCCDLFVAKVCCGGGVLAGIATPLSHRNPSPSPSTTARLASVMGSSRRRASRRSHGTPEQTVASSSGSSLRCDEFSSSRASRDEYTYQ